MKWIKWNGFVLLLSLGVVGWSGQLMATPLPDLIIDYVTITPQNPKIGQNLTIQFAIKNIGEAAASPAKAAIAAMELYQPLNIPTGNVTTQTLSPGQSQVFTYSGLLNAQQFNISTGLHTFGVDLNLAKNPQESNYQNNFAMVQFYIYPQSGGTPTQLPDLTVSSLTLSPTTPLKGKAVTVVMTVANNGPGKSTSTKAFFTGNEAVLKALGLPLPPNDFSVPALNPGQTFSQNFSSPNVTLEPGDYEFTALVNTKIGAIPETNTENNKRTLNFHVIPSISPGPWDKPVQKIPGPGPQELGPMKVPQKTPAGR